MSFSRLSFKKPNCSSIVAEFVVGAALAAIEGLYRG
jgi:hypothetical protein